MASELGRIPVAQLIEDGDLVINDGYRAKNSELSISGLPFARAQNINEGFHFDDADRFPEDDLHKVGIKISQPGDVVFTSKGTVGRFALVRPDTPRFVYAPQLCFWRSTNPNRLDPLYLYYWMNSREFFVQFKGVSGQTDMAEYVSLRDQRAMHITLPEISVQRRIASILGALDDKIELNRRMNRTLEKMAAAVFKSWFIDFDPVRAKAENRDPGLPAEIAGLFPDAFEDSPLGPIPEGWAVSSVGDQFNLVMGQSPPGRTYNENREGAPFFQGRADFGFRYPSNRVYCTAPTRFANKDDTLISVRAPVGDVNMALDRCSVGRGVAAARHNSGSRSFTYYSMQSLRSRFHVFDREGTVFGSISKKDFEAILWIAPPAALVDQFELLCGSLDQRIELNELQNRRLTGLRDRLLPRLLCGEIGVPVAENVGKEVP